MRIALTGLVALAVAMGIGRFAFTPLLPMMQADAGLGLAQGGWLASANYAGYLIGALTAPRAVLGIRGSLLAISITTFAMALVQDFPSWIALRALAGIASAWVLVQVSSWALPRLSHPSLAGTVYAGVGAGIFAAGILCFAMMSLQATSRDAWMALGGVSLLATFFLWPAFSSVEASQAASGGREWSPRSLALISAYGAFGFGYIVPATFLPAMARALLDDPGVFGWAWPVFGLAAAASTVTVVKFAKDNRRLWIGAQLAMALGVAAPVVIPGLPGILFSALCVGGTFMVITMAGLREAMAVAGSHAARLMAAMTAAFAAGQIAGPVFISLLVQQGWPFDVGLLIASAALTAGAFALVNRRPAS
jgi:MFS family permease